MQVKGELDINRMPEREAKRILDRIVSAYVRTQLDNVKCASAICAVLDSEGLVIDENYEEVRKKHMFMQEFWTLTKKYWIPENTDAYWNALISDCQQLSKKYTDSFVEDMLIAFINNREKEGKRNEKQKNVYTGRVKPAGSNAEGQRRSGRCDPPGRSERTYSANSRALPDGRRTYAYNSERVGDR